MPKRDTFFWECEREKPAFAFPEEVGVPILVSYSDFTNGVVLCTRGAVSINRGVQSSFSYDEIKEIHDLKLSSEEKKADLSMLKVCLKNGKDIKVPADMGSPAFGIWNILIMLMRMS